MALANAIFTVEDYDGETSTVNVNINDATATNFGSLQQDANEIRDAINLVSRGELRSVKITTSQPESSAVVTDIEAAREGKWNVTYRDTTAIISTGYGNPGFNKLFTFEIPCADRTLLPANSDEADLTDPDWVTFVAGIEPNIRSPYNRNPGTGITPTNEVVSVKYVGRNL